MRRWFVLLMIVLLPVRGWAGDFMGIQMAMAAGATPAAHEMPTDCPMHASADMSTHDGDSSDAPTDDGPGSNCTSCQLCTPVAQLPTAPLLRAHAPVRSAPESARTDFVSALLPPAVEPPIS
jgi:hypothetical protein